MGRLKICLEKGNHRTGEGGGEAPFGSFYVRSAILIQGQREGQCKTSHIVVKYQPASVAHVGEEGKGGQIFFSPRERSIILEITYYLLTFSGVTPP